MFVPQRSFLPTISMLCKVLMTINVPTLFSRDGNPGSGQGAQRRPRVFTFGVCHLSCLDISMPLPGNQVLLLEDSCCAEGPFSGDSLHPGCTPALDRACAVEYTGLVGTILVTCCYSRHILAPTLCHMGSGGPSSAKSFGVVPIYDTSTCLRLGAPAIRLLNYRYRSTLSHST